jgi:hypothetical protein
MSSSFASPGGISEKRIRVRPAGSQDSRSRLTYLVAKLALALGIQRNSSTRSRTLSLISASTEQSEFSPMSYTHADGSTSFGTGLVPCRATCRDR